MPIRDYIRFEVANARALQRLRAVVQALSKAKTSDADVSWRSYFDSSELAHFWSPSEAERQRWQTHWFSTPLPQRHSPNMPQPGWHFESMIDSILQSDCALTGVTAENSREAYLAFTPHGHPFGGVDALRALVRCFGHRVTGFHDGVEFINGDPQPPRWMPS